MISYPHTVMSHARTAEEIMHELSAALVTASRILPDDAVGALETAREHSSGPASSVMDAIFRNLEMASEKGLPMCQDTGMGWFLVRKPPGFAADMRPVIHEALRHATREGRLRSSVVAHPLERENTGTNLPPVIHEETHDGPLEISFYLRGFGSENSGGAWLMRPTAGMDDVVAKITDRLAEVGGGACPPLFLGIGLGGTLDLAALLAKKALFREAGRHADHPADARLEEAILQASQSLGIGPGGTGSGPTVLWAAVKSHPTHIAGLPVVLAVSCWADRRGTLVFGEVTP